MMRESDGDHPVLTSQRSGDDHGYGWESNKSLLRYGLITVEKVLLSSATLHLLERMIPFLIRRSLLAILEDLLSSQENYGEGPPH